MDRIVVGIPAHQDGTEALRWAYEHALPSRSEILVVNVRPHVGIAHLAHPTPGDDLALRHLHQSVYRALGPLACEHVVSHRVCFGDTVTELAEAAHLADMIVLPAPAKRRGVRVSLADRCARRTSCAVIEVPPRWSQDHSTLDWSQIERRVSPDQLPAGHSADN